MPAPGAPSSGVLSTASAQILLQKVLIVQNPAFAPTPLDLNGTEIRNLTSTPAVGLSSVRIEVLQYSSYDDGSGAVAARNGIRWRPIYLAAGYTANEEAGTTTLGWLPMYVPITLIPGVPSSFTVRGAFQQIAIELDADGLAATEDRIVVTMSASQ